jgi:predicted nuclease of predicted toxin-antitoxin system
VKLLLDEHYTDEIAAALRAAGHDAVTVSERGLKGLDDEPLLALAASEDRALLTNNARDFPPLVRRWAESGEDHCGLLLTSDSSMPRGKASIGLYVERLRKLMDAGPAGRALANQVRWLP